MTEEKMEEESTKCDKIQRILKKAQNELALKQGNESRNEEVLVKTLRKSITVRGFGKCKVTSGKVLCEGYEFDPESKRGESEFQIYAPTGHHAVELFPLGSDATVEFIAGKRVPTFPELENGMFPVKDKVDGEEIIPGLYQTREDGFVVPKELENVISSIIDCRYRNIMMVGGKGSGKSSANRYACNRLLKKFGKVIWLECDPGQPEFDVPGFMSLTEVYLPRVGPSYCTLGQEYYTTRARTFLGDISPGQNPRRYMQCVNFLQSQLKLHYKNSGLPVIYNGMGWIRALGLALTQDIIRDCDVELIYYLKANSSNDLPDGMDSQGLLATRGYQSYPSPSDEKVKIIEDASVTAKAGIDRKRITKGSQREWHAKDKRDALYSIYFNRIFNREEYMSPCRISLNNCVFNVLNRNVSDIFGLLENSLVGLTTIDRQYFPRIDRDGIRRISYDNGFEFCYGFAWIVKIDKEKGEILIHSDMTLDELKRLDINCFISANLPLPIDNFFEKEAMKSYPKSKPYLHVRNYDLATANKFKNTQVLKKKTEK